MRERLHIVFLIGILFLALFFRVWRLAPTTTSNLTVPPGLFSDEAMNGSNALEALETGKFKVFYRENNGREGLFINLQALSIRILGNTAFALRIVSALFGTATVLAVYLFTKEYLRDNHIALLASFLLSVSFWHIMFSRIGFRAIMAPFFLTTGLWLLYAVWDRRNDLHHARVLLGSALGGIFFGLGFYSYIAYRAAPLLLLPALALFVQSARKEKNNCIICIPALFVFFAFVVTIPLTLYFLDNPGDFLGRTGQISIFQSEYPFFAFLKNAGITFQMFYFLGDFNARHNIPGNPLLWWPIAVFFTIGLVLAFRKRYWLLISWLIVMMLPVAVSNEGIPHALRSIIMIPPVFIIAAIGFASALVTLYHFTHSRFVQTIVTALAVIIVVAHVIHTYNTYFIEWGESALTKESFGGNLYNIGLFLNNMPEDTLKYVVTDETETIDRTGRPMSLEPILFATDTYLPRPEGYKNIYYRTTAQLDSLNCQTDCMIIPIRNSYAIFALARKKYPNLQFDRSIEQKYQLLVARPK